MLTRKSGLRVALVPPRKGAALLTHPPPSDRWKASGRRASRQSTRRLRRGSNKGRLFAVSKTWTPNPNRCNVTFRKRLHVHTIHHQPEGRHG